MATEGKSARDILAFYFPGTALRITASDDGWSESKIGALTVRSARTLSAQEQSLIQHTWNDAQQRFGKASAMKLLVVLAPTTEMFRQLAVQPGWALASSRAERIVMQPEAVFATNKVDRMHTLRHEMLHVLVESEAGEHTQLWLREGLVEVLNGEAAPTATTSNPQDIDRALLSASTWAQAEQAHRAAAIRVTKLIARYGMTTVRGWLVSGVPASATA